MHNIGVAGYWPSIGSGTIAFMADERADGTDYNGNGYVGDNVVVYYDLDTDTLAIASAKQTWTRNGSPRIAGVSSFGFGGTNAHVVLEEAPVHDAPSAMLDAAEVLLKGGSPRAAILVASAALDAQHDLVARPDGQVAATPLGDTSTHLATMRAAVVAGDPVTTDDAGRAIAAVRSALD